MCSARRRFPVRAEAQIHAVRRAQGEAVRARDFLGFDKNVIVQATCHDTDNRALVDALDNSNGKAKGVAFVDEDFTDDAVEGARWRGRERRPLQLHQAAGRFHPEGRDAAHRGAHRQARLAHRDLFRARRPRRDGPVPEIAADHAGVRPHGLPERERRRRGQGTSRTGSTRSTHNKRWINKVSCPERFSLAGPPYDDVVPFARVIVERFPDRVLWGTDWPHPNMKNVAPDEGVLIDMIPKIAPTAALQRQTADRQPDAALLGLSARAFLRAGSDGHVAVKTEGIQSSDGLRALPRLPTASM